MNSVFRSSPPQAGATPAGVWYESTEMPFKLHTATRPPQAQAAHFKRLYRSDAAFGCLLFTAGLLRRVSSDRGLTFQGRNSFGSG